MATTTRRRGTVAKHREVGDSSARDKPQSTRGVGRRKPSLPAVDDAAILPMLRNSERSTLKRCEFLWDLTYNRKLKPLTDAPALRFGSLIHAALAQYYIPGVKRGISPVKAFKKVYDADLKVNAELFGMKMVEDEKWVNAEELGLAMMENYLDHWGSDSDWEVIVTEHPFEIVVCHPDGTPWFIYVGVLDGVWKHRKTKELWIPDHKSTAGIGGSQKYPKIPAWLRIDDQAGGYWSYGVDALIEQALMKKNQQLSGMLYNYLRKAMPDERPSRIVNGERMYLNKPTKACPEGEISKSQPSPYFARIPILRDEYDKQMARDRAAVDYRRIEMLRSGELEMTKSPGMFTCPGCAMRDACELHETGHDVESFLTGTSKTWDPYAEHEIYDGR